MRNYIATLVSLILIPTPALAQAEVPVLVRPPNTTKIMMLVDDSGSMNAVLEHPDFSPTGACATDQTKHIPSVIFKLISGSASPSTSHNLQPMLIELNVGFASSSETGDLWAARPFNSPTAFPLIRGMNCSNTQGQTACCPGTSGGSCPRTGISTGSLFNPTTFVSPTIGSNIFSLSNLSSADSSGNEYLYLSYRGNTYENGYDNWNDVWATFDGRGVVQDNFTTPYGTTGGTVRFNNREVFLSQGWYRKEYLRWIFHCATAEQVTSLPGKNRLQAVKDVMTTIINENSSVQFGLATFNGSGYSPGVHSGNSYMQWYSPAGNSSTCTTGRIRRPIGTSANLLISELATLAPSGGTPLTNSYIEVLRYLGGAGDRDSCTSSTSNYTSPISGQCDAHAVIMLTDGLPTSEVANQLPNGSFPTNLDSVANPVGTQNNCGSGNSACFSSFLPDASWWAYHTDLRASIPGIQNITSYAVAFGLKAYPLLNRFAQTGGTGTAYTPTTSEELNDTLQSIVSAVFDTPTSGAGVATLEKVYGEAKVYQPIFYADSWTSRIQVYRYDDDQQKLIYEYDMADLLEARSLSTHSRKIVAGYDTDFDGNTNQTIEFNSSRAAELRSILFRSFDTGTLPASALAEPLRSYAQTSSAETLIRFISGEDIEGLRERDRNSNGMVDRLGDIVYSKPVEVGPKNGLYDTLQGYNDFVASRKSSPRLLLVGSNDGMLHAFDSSTGEEVWAYIPSSLLPQLERLARLDYDRQHRRAYVDGPITVEDVYRNGAWRTLVMFGLRTGGTSYTVLDITDRRNPTLVWEVSNPSVYGQSWSKPVVVPHNNSSDSSSPNSFLWSMVIGNGEGRPSAGTVLAVYDLNSASPPSPFVVTLNGGDPSGTRTTGVATSQNDKDRNVDRLYVGTESGDLYRVRVQGTAGGWQVNRLYDGPTTQPIVATPLLVLADNPQFTGNGGNSPLPHSVGIYFGSGRYDQASDVATVSGSTQAIVGIFDPINIEVDAYEAVLGTQTPSMLQNQGASSFSVRRHSSSGKYFTPLGRNGFYLPLATSISLNDGFIEPVGEVVHQPTNIRGEVLFTTFLPDAGGSCDIGGHSFLQPVHFQTGGGAVVDFTQPDKPFYNGGLADYDQNGTYNSADAVTGVRNGTIEALFDAKVKSVNLSEAVTPYRHDGELKDEDIRVSSNGGILPSVAAIGHTGLAGSPHILLGAKQIVVQDAYPADPETPENSGSPGTTPSSEEGGDSGGDIGSTDRMPPPKLAPFNIYNLPIDVLSFHQVTGQ